MTKEKLDDLIGDFEHDGTCLSRHRMEDIAKLVGWLLSVEKSVGMSVEAMDAVIAELERGGSIDEAMWFATCEWDL